MEEAKRIATEDLFYMIANFWGRNAQRNINEWARVIPLANLKVKVADMTFDGLQYIPDDLESWYEDEELRSQEYLPEMPVSLYQAFIMVILFNSLDASNPQLDNFIEQIHKLFIENGARLES